MNILRNKSKLVYRATALLSLTAMVIASCGKDNNNVAPVARPGALAIAHASPGSPEYSFYINGTKASTKSLTYGTFLSYGTINSGKYEFAITKKDGKDVLTKSIVDIQSDKAYSLYIADLPSKPVFVFTADDLSVPAAEKAKIRFINLSPDAGDLDLKVAGKDSSLFKKTSFKTGTGFVSIDPGAELNFEVTTNAQSTVLATLPKTKIEKGKIYTIWAKGLKAATDSTKFALGLITNK
jgi:hypothetical protein